jgi:hypothetical protein
LRRIDGTADRVTASRRAVDAMLASWTTGSEKDGYELYGSA